MQKFVISFFEEQFGLIQEILESSSESDAIKFFFENFIKTYSKNIEGFQFFLDDFNDSKIPLGRVIEIKN